MKVQRTGIVLNPNPRRVLLRPFCPTSEERISRIIGRIMVVPDELVERQLSETLAEFGDRHRRLGAFFLRRYEQIRQHVVAERRVSQARRMLIGAYFTQEYALESAALFNPSPVWHPDQSRLPDGSRRFILSLRATGEGHISSITFRSGVIDAKASIIIDQPTPFVSAPDAVLDTRYGTQVFDSMLNDLGLANDFSDAVVAGLGESFTANELKSRIQAVLNWRRFIGHERATAQDMLSLAQSGYEVVFAPEQPLSERIIFPLVAAESNGIEDARFVEFLNDDGSTTYYATYTAYDGKAIVPRLLETSDFVRFRSSTLHGSAVRNKGFALFPRKIKGQYAMLSRQDNENLYLMFSDLVSVWPSNAMLLEPRFPWEFVQIGNCGSPIETGAGWLVLCHGVGPMRKYSLGAFLLDGNDPSQVIGRLAEPLLSPNKAEREGYVPNVVYSCGALVHGRQLIVPYALADYASSFAIIALDDLLAELSA